ncbi:hypothetical protein CNMCM8980_006917 [Aspergillus fumigatiaffinis]|uniref:Zn(2)-C6 fungal-type domain-containing protein n=1 Tax=Aspergillus fumigatiaffinis TaxID=340414 RepID=A0A8H4H8F1_9EURO|nr:hypothetical protein CNMCM5878_009566 [Aspergillus fumigatiaffinis]KAF4230539.1 hypothetical protein CNMCM6457_005884 [Aspergillus fumigatiaffinis]KAF4237787.1 hypothetical protein CNMCM6805_006844 [Aspergillus fumigatiaffinis]KAF4247849.1 hypothetical protein CNMCM8980_006917 [Aspergillus fumigatiaffinis]
MTDRTNSGVRNSFRARACDNCRQRKIKCNKAIPCSSCGALGIPCRANGVTVSTPEPPQRTAAGQYEKKIDALQEQLAAIQNTLQQITQSPIPPQSTHPVAVDIPSTPSAPLFEGQSSFNNEVIIARDAAFSAIATSQPRRVDAHVSAVLSSLRNSLDRQQGSSTVIEPLSQSKVELLPQEFLITLIKKVKVDPIPAGSLTLLHGLLYYIIRDYLHEECSDLARFDLAAYAGFCERHFLAGLKSYEMMCDPTLQKVQALLIGIIKAQEESDLQLCWTYLALAFNMCQSMGLHRSAALKHDPVPVADAKRHAFWSLYTIDKNLSLNLGLASHFQNHDIDAELFTPSDNPQYRPWDLMTLTTIDFATLQGRIYDRLYSTSATQATESERLKSIEELSNDLMLVRERLLGIDVSQGLYAESLHGMAACADFITHSVMTVILRAQTRASNAMAITSQCYEAAMRALQSHLECFTYFRNRKTHKQTEYVNWILLYPSFTPFVIVFIHAITTASTFDLALLQDTVQSLELFKGLSRGSDRLYTICAAFSRTAQILVDSEETLEGLTQHRDGSLVMPALDSNIALPNVEWPENVFDSHMNSTDISMFLNDFIGTHRSVMDILNSDYMNET